MVYFSIEDIPKCDVDVTTNRVENIKFSDWSGWTVVDNIRIEYVLEHTETETPMDSKYVKIISIEGNIQKESIPYACQFSEKGMWITHFDVNNKTYSTILNLHYTILQTDEIYSYKYFESKLMFIREAIQFTQNELDIIAKYKCIFRNNIYIQIGGIKIKAKHIDVHEMFNDFLPKFSIKILEISGILGKEDLPEKYMETDKEFVARMDLNDKICIRSCMSIILHEDQKLGIDEFIYMIDYIKKASTNLKNIKKELESNVITNVCN